MCYGNVHDQYADDEKPLQDKKKGLVDTTKNEGREQTDKNIEVEKPDLERRYQVYIEKIKEKNRRHKKSSSASKKWKVRKHKQ